MLSAIFKLIAAATTIRRNVVRPITAETHKLRYTSIIIIITVIYDKYAI